MKKVNGLDYLIAANELKEKVPTLFSAMGMNEEELAGVMQKEVADIFDEHDVPFKPEYIFAHSELLFPYLDILELGTATLAKLASVADIRATIEGLPVFWHELELNGYEPPPSVIFFAIMSVLANNLFAIRNLVLNGLDGQANTLARSHQELLAITLAISVNEQLFKDYVEGPIDDEVEIDHWRRIKKQVIDENRKYYEEEHPEDAQGIIKTIMIGHSQRSLFVHSQMLGIVQSTHHRGLHKSKNDKPECVIGGLPCHETKGTIHEVCADTWMFLINIRKILFSDHHGWQQIGENRETLMADCLMNSFIFLYIKHLPSMHKEFQELIAIQRKTIKENQSE